MEPITRQLTSQSNKSIFVVALDQGGPMVSHTMETINHHDTSDDENDYYSTHSDDRRQSTNHQQHRDMKSNERRSMSSDITIHHQDNDNKSLPPATTNINQSPLSSSSSPPPSPSSPSLAAWWRKPFNCRKAQKDNDNLPDPRAFSTTKKTMILMIVAGAGASSPLASTIYYPALIEMQNAFNTSDTAMNASISIFTFFTAFFPLLWATAGDRIGRRKIYLMSFLISVIGSLCCGFAVNITMFIVFRAFSAIGSSSVMSMGAGTLADIFAAHERGRAFAWYTCGPLLGPALGPIIGGYLSAGLGWRSTFYFLAIFNLCILLAIFFFLPETWRSAAPPPIIGLDKEKTRLQQQQQQKKKKRPINPLEALDLLLNPNIALAVIFVGVLFFALYIINTTFSRTYASQYGLDSGTVGLCYLPNAIGCMVGGIAGGRMSDARYNRSVANLNNTATTTQNEASSSPSKETSTNNQQVKQQQQQPYPEMRLGGVLFYGAIVLNLFALTAYGWCVQENVHFAYGMVCQFFVGLALMVPNVTLSAYMVDCFRKRGASVTACNNFARYIMAGIGSLVSSDLERALGSGPLFTMLGGALLVFSVNLVIIQWKSNDWRLAKQAKELENDLQVPSS